MSDENERLRKALKFYADGDHLQGKFWHRWDTVSGEPINWLHPDDDRMEGMVESGGIAKAALAGKDWSEDECERRERN